MPLEPRSACERAAARRSARHALGVALLDPDGQGAVEALVDGRARRPARAPPSGPAAATAVALVRSTRPPHADGSSDAPGAKGQAGGRPVRRGRAHRGPDEQGAVAHLDLARVGQAAEGDRDRLAHRADHVRQLLVGQVQVEADAVRRHAPPSLGELAQLQQQPPLDARLEGDRDRELPVGDLRGQQPHQVGGENGLAHPGLHARAVHQVEQRVLDGEAAHLGAHGGPAVERAHQQVALLEDPDGPLAALRGDEEEGEPPAVHEAADRAGRADLELLAGGDLHRAKAVGRGRARPSRPAKSSMVRKSARSIMWTRPRARSRRSCSPWRGRPPTPSSPAGGTPRRGRARCRRGRWRAARGCRRRRARR